MAETPRECKHPLCGKTCHKPKKQKKIYFLKRTPIKKKPGKRIRQHSKKRAKINRDEYGPKARKYVEDNPVCNIKSPVCTHDAGCVNHRKGKDSIAMLLDHNFWEPSCWPCNGWIEENDAWARERGHKLSKHSKTNNGNSYKPDGQCSDQQRDGSIFSDKES